MKFNRTITITLTFVLIESDNNLTMKQVKRMLHQLGTLFSELFHSLFYCNHEVMNTRIMK